MIGERLSRWRRTAAFGAFGLVVYLIALRYAFPYDRIKDIVVASAAMSGLDVEMESYGPGLGVGMAMSDVKVKTRPTDGSKPVQFAIDEGFLSFAILARLSGDEAFGFTGQALGGDIGLDVRAAPKRGETKITAREIQLKALPGVKEALNLPLAGVIDLDLGLVQPNHRMAEANGTISWKCDQCAVGDGKEKLKVASNPMLAEGITIPKVRLNDFAGKIVIDKGVGKLQGVRMRSPDGELSAEGEIKFSDPVGYSYLDLYVRFKFSEAMLKSNDKLQIMMQLAESMGKRPDGFYGFRVTGTLSRPSGVVWQKTSPFEGRGGARPSAAH